MHLFTIKHVFKVRLHTAIIIVTIFAVCNTMCNRLQLSSAVKISFWGSCTTGLPAAEVNATEV